jgi:NADH dehydrogenase
MSQRVLVTGGTGVIGTAAVSELLRRGHRVRLLSRHAREDARQWKGVEPFEGDVADAASLGGAAENCDAVLHIAGIASEGERTFEEVNVTGTRNLIAAARDGNVRRFVYVSSLGADTGTSDYHRSKRAAEVVVRGSGFRWTIARPGNVFGPGDEVISTILKMVRALPAVPVVGDGAQPFQPIWHLDLAKALGTIVERDDLAGQTLELAGDEVTSMNDLLERFNAITGKSALRVPLPEVIVAAAAKLANAAGAEVPVDETKLTMLRETNVIEGANALATLGITPTPLDEALRALADALPEQLPEDGVGSLMHKTYAAEIRGSGHTPESLIELVRERAAELMPVDFQPEPGTPTRLDRGATLTGHLPLRGNMQVRVEAVEPRRVIFATIDGHPLAGFVELSAQPAAVGVRFAIDVTMRAANPLDLVAMKTIGVGLQDANWRHTVQAVVDASGGSADEVTTAKETLEGSDAEAANGRIKALVQARQRDGE